MSTRWRCATVSIAAGDAHLNPQWSADDRDLYFVSDPDGTMNIYRARAWTRAIAAPRSRTSTPASAASRRPVRRCRWPTARSVAGLHGLRARPAATGRARTSSATLDGEPVVEAMDDDSDCRRDRPPKARSIRYLADSTRPACRSPRRCRAATTRRGCRSRESGSRT